MPADDAVHLSSYHQVWASEEGCDVAGDSEHARDVACSIILQGLGKGPVTAVIPYQESPC